MTSSPPGPLMRDSCAGASYSLAGREEPVPEPLGLVREREQLPPRAAARFVVVDHPGGGEERVVEPDEQPLLVGDDEVARRRVDDVADEVALALQLVQPGEQLRLEPVALDADPQRPDDEVDELGLLSQHGVVDERADRPVVVGDRRHHARRGVLRQLRCLPGDVDVVLAIGEPVDELEGRVAERLPQVLLCFLGRSRAAPVEEEPADVTACEAAAQDAPQKEVGHGKEGERSERVDDLGRDVGDRLQAEAEAEGRDADPADQQDGPEEPAAGRRRSAPVLDHGDRDPDQEHGAEQLDDEQDRARGGCVVADQQRVLRAVVAPGRRLRLEERDGDVGSGGEGVAEDDECVLSPAGDQPARVREERVDEDRGPDRADRVPDRPDERAVRVRQPVQQPREPDGDQQDPGPVLGPPGARDQPGRDERPADDAGHDEEPDGRRVAVVTREPERECNAPCD